MTLPKTVEIILPQTCLRLSLSRKAILVLFLTHIYVSLEGIPFCARLRPRTGIRVNPNRTEHRLLRDTCARLGIIPDLLSDLKIEVLFPN